MVTRRAFSILTLGALSQAGAASAQATSASPEMQRLLALLEGNWRTQTRYEPNPQIPQGGRGEGAETSRRGPGGHSVLFETRSTGPSGSFEGAGVTTWDAETRVYRLL